MRRKTWAELLLQLGESVDDLLDATLPSVVNRTTCKRSESRTENHSCIEQVGIGDDAFCKTRACFIDEREHEAVLEITIGTRMVA
jgi:hypothetical protein